MLPLLQQLFRFLQQHTLLSRIRDIAILFEQGADVDCLAAPEVPMDSPVERELQGATVERQCCLPRHGGRVSLFQSSAKFEDGSSSSICGLRDQFDTMMER